MFSRKDVKFTMLNILGIVLVSLPNIVLAIYTLAQAGILFTFVCMTFLGCCTFSGIMLLRYRKYGQETNDAVYLQQYQQLLFDAYLCQADLPIPVDAMVSQAANDKAWKMYYEMTDRIVQKRIESFSVVPTKLVNA
jgi:hypothetical protein